MSEGNEAASAATAARELAAALLEQADALDLHDLRATTAIEQVRIRSRELADAVYERGWGELFLGIDSFDPDDDTEVELGPEDFEDPDDYRAFVEGDEDVAGLPLPEQGTRVSYQARYDFVVTDPEAFVEYARGRAAEVNNDDVVEDIHDALSAFELLTFIDGVGSKDYDAIGLSPAGGEESQKEIEHSLWDLDPTRRDDTYPY